MQWGKGMLEKGGGMGDGDPALLPNELSKDWSASDLDSFLAAEGLQPTGDPRTLKERAWRLSHALSSPGFLNPDLSQAQASALK